MLISDSNQFVFVHVAKTGGDSIKLALWPLSIGPNLSHRSSILRYAGLPRDYRRFRFRVHGPAARTAGSGRDLSALLQVCLCQEPLGPPGVRI